MSLSNQKLKEPSAAKEMPAGLKRNHSSGASHHRFKLKMPDQAKLNNANYHYDSAAYPKLRIYGQRQEVLEPTTRVVHSNEKENHVNYVRPFLP